MPINAEIPLQVRSPEPIDPSDTLAKAISLRSFVTQNALHQQQMRENELQMQQRQEAMRGDKDMAELIAQHSTPGQGGMSVDHDAIVQGLAQRGHGALAKTYEANARADAKAKLENQKNELENHAKRVALYSGLTTPVVNAAAGWGEQVMGPDGNEVMPKSQPQDVETQYQLSRQQAMGMKLDGLDAAPRTLLNPDGTLNLESLAKVRGMHQSAIGAQDNIKNGMDTLNFGQKILDARATAAKEAPKTEREWLTLGTGIMAASPDDPEHWAEGLHHVETVLAGAPAETRAGVLKMIGPYTPGAPKRAMALGMTPEQQSSAGQTSEYHQQMIDLGQQNADTRKLAQETAATARNELKASLLYGLEKTKATALASSEKDLAKAIKEEALDQDPPQGPNHAKMEAERQKRLQALYAENEKRKAQAQQDYLNEHEAIRKKYPDEATAPEEKVFPKSALADFAKQRGESGAQAESFLRSQGYKIR